MKWKSNASWTNIGNSSDTHETEQMAVGVCVRLKKEYGPGTKGCEVRGHCTNAWVTEIEEEDDE